jgi:hypothetical protein
MSDALSSARLPGDSRCRNRFSDSKPDHCLAPFSSLDALVSAQVKTDLEQIKTRP